MCNVPVRITSPTRQKEKEEGGQGGVGVGGRGAGGEGKRKDYFFFGLALSVCSFSLLTGPRDSVMKCRAHSCRKPLAARRGGRGEGGICAEITLPSSPLALVRLKKKKKSLAVL